MTTPAVVSISLWRNDCERNLEGRIAHLLDKTYRPLRFIWIVGDSEDDTERALRYAAANSDRDIAVIKHDTGIIGQTPDLRLARIGQTADAGLACILPSDDYMMLHESDLITPPDIVERFLATGKMPIAGWPTLGNRFYDTYAYRKDGAMFTNDPPYHACYRDNEIFEVDCFGSCWMAHASDFVGGARGDDWGVIGICEELKARGRALWVDPHIPVIQPPELWQERLHASR